MSSTYKSAYAAAMLAILFVFSQSATAQTLFETAGGEGIINFRTKTLSQFKVNATATSIAYGYYYVKGKRIDRQRLLISVDVRSKPNGDGLSSLLNGGQIQPGVNINGSIGYRMISGKGAKFLNVVDIYFKPEYAVAGYKIYDETRFSRGQDPAYKTTEQSYGANIGINYALFPGTTNIYLGAQIGYLSTNNADDFDKVDIQTTRPNPANGSQVAFTSEEMLEGVLKDVNKTPLVINAVVDPFTSIRGGEVTNMRPAFFGYLKTDLQDETGAIRTGFGFCLVGIQNPSKTYLSLGYELPKFGSGVTVDNKGKGSLFIALGLSMFK